MRKYVLSHGVYLHKELIYEEIDKDLKKLREWFDINKLIVTVDKTTYINFNSIGFIFFGGPVSLCRLYECNDRNGEGIQASRGIFGREAIKGKKK